ncbi:MAG: spermidine/putrescine ABC transporter substrate-binding protein [Oscillibacter sp.]|jgi:spermidine/putrescine transport system substrate-binding protein|nr:spermidine/putrescine ABC transporter substrate-binding protein [Oscillibacter sp.]
MKRIVSVLLAVMMVSTLLTGCGDSADKYPNGEVNVLNWGEYIDEDVIPEFEEEYGIKVNYKVCSDNETLYSTLSGGGSDYDVIVPSDYMISRLISEGMLEKLDFSNIPNFSDVDAKFLNPAYDATGEYSVPYMWGTVGIIYNTTMVNGDITSWSALFDKQYAGQVLMINNPRDAIGVALKYLGYSYNTTDKSQIKEATDLLIQQKEDGIVQAYVMDEIFDKMEGGEAAIGVYYAGDYLTMLENNPDLAFVVPSEGSNYFVDAMCIPKGASNKENGEKFINFMCSTDVGKDNCESIGYSSPLMSVKDALDPEISGNPVAYPSDEVLASCEQFINLPADILEFYDSEWLRLKV